MTVAPAERNIQLKAEGLKYREIHDCIRAKGYSGTQDAIRGYISKERRIRRDLQAAVGGESVGLIDKKWLIRLLYKPIEDVKGISPAQLAAIFQSYPLAESFLNLVNDFKSLLKAKKSDELLLWMDKVALLGLPELDAFVNGLKHDIDAVINAFTTDLSNGLVEGTVDKIKVIKRLNREIRRRTRVVGEFPDGNSALMLVCVRLRHVAGFQWGYKKYMNMKHLATAADDALIAA